MCEIADALEEIGAYKKLILQTCCKLKKGYSVAEIADMLEEKKDVIQKIYDIAISYAPNYDAKKIFECLNQ